VRSKISFLWLGWLGQEVPEADQPKVAAQLLKEHSCIPVFLPADISDDFYNGLCNGFIWPNFHVELDPDTTFDPTGKLWAAYRKANVCFAQTVLSVAKKNDLIFLHDYHLMLLPFLLRRYLGDEAVISWFLHTPWPSSEIFRMLPVRGEILRGLLAADLLGFHTADYARHFLSSCQRLLPDVSASPSSITVTSTNPTDGTTTTTRTKLAIDPIGIEPEVFVATSESPQCQARIKELADKFGSGNRRIIVSVDRLDLIKGLVQRLLGLETFFRLYPQWVGKVSFVQIAVPSRDTVPAYMKLRREINTLVAKLNTTYGDLSTGYVPVHYLYRSIDPVELCALYSVGDACLVTSVRDGLNLVSEEFVACQGNLTPNRTAPGVIVLSEFAGVAQSLGSGALRCNPWDPKDIASSLDEALSMPDSEKLRRWSLMDAYIREFTSQHWATSFVDEMKAIQADKVLAMASKENKQHQHHRHHGNAAATKDGKGSADSAAPVTRGQPSQSALEVAAGADAGSSAPLAATTPAPSASDDDEEGSAIKHEQAQSLAVAITELAKTDEVLAQAQAATTTTTTTANTAPTAEGAKDAAKK
jgi:alpha,alpha-trehalose-phosphate synthase [UDP-forming]